MCSFSNLNKMDVVFSPSKVKDLEAAARTIMEAMSFKSLMDLRNALLLGSSELFPQRMWEKSSRVLHDFEKTVKKSKTLQFSQLAQQFHVSECPGPQSSRPAPGKGTLSGSKTLSSSDRRGRSFESFLPPSQLQVGGILGRHWNSWTSYGAEDWLLESPLLQLSHLFPSPPTCVEGTSQVPFLQLRVCEGSGTSRRSGQDAGERYL